MMHSKAVGAFINVTLIALWGTYFAKAGVSIEGILALVTFFAIFLILSLSAKLVQLNLEFLKLSTAAYEQFKNKST